MRYMGGKCRQSRAISDVLRRDNGGGFAYCEPFAGGMGSASRVITDLNPSRVLLSDVSVPLITMWRALVDGSVELPCTVTDDDYKWYKDHQSDTDDPLLAWFGHGISFGGKWFGGMARHTRGKRDSYDVTSEVRSTMRRVDVLRGAPNVEIVQADYRHIVPDLHGWVVYCDPPYEGGTKAHLHSCANFDYNEFWDVMRNLSKHNQVYVSCFVCPPDFVPVYQWGDTVVRHHQFGNIENSSVNEKLVIFRGQDTP